MTDAPLDLCFVAHTAFGEMVGGTSGPPGGIQRQQSFMARWLAARGHRVAMLVWDERQPAETTVDGVRILKMCREEEGLPGLRFFHPRWTSLVRALRQADARVYYHNTSEYVTGQVAYWCGRNGRRFVFSTANDRDVLPEMLARRSLRERVLYRYGLRHADRLVAQTRTQQELLRRHFQLESVVIPMPCPPPPGGLASPDREAPRVLWAGRIARVKRLELLLEVAALCPGVTFDVAGVPEADNEYTRDLLARAPTVANVVLHGRVERDRMPALYRSASLLVCTSSHEGFPNTFLEAWSHGVPLVTTFDPDGLVAERGLGACAADAAGLAQEIRRLLGDRAAWETASRNGLRYYQENHTPDATMTRFAEVFAEASR